MRPRCSAFAQDRPNHDLLFCPRKIQPAERYGRLDNGSSAARSNKTVGGEEGEVVGAAPGARPVFLVFFFLPHVGESSMWSHGRARAGVGRARRSKTFDWRWARDWKSSRCRDGGPQQAAIALFERAGLKAEALLRDHVATVDGKTHDIVAARANVGEVRAQLEAYGVPGAAPAMRLIGGQAASAF